MTDMANNLKDAFFALNTSEEKNGRIMRLNRACPLAFVSARIGGERMVLLREKHLKKSRTYWMTDKKRQSLLTPVAGIVF
jgi:hypothetical protein